MEARMSIRFDNNNNTDRSESDAPWLIIPLLLAVIMILGLGLIFGWSLA